MRRFAAVLSLLSACSMAAGSASAQSGNAPLIVAVCAPCHGYDGVGRDVQIPSIGGQSGIYLGAQLRAFRAGRRKHPDMSTRAEDLTDRDIDQLVNYYSILPAR
jgi:cytochrome c553